MTAALTDPVAPPLAGTEVRLRDYLALLLRWNARVNLVSRGDEGSFWQRHVEDSLRLLPLVPAGVGRVIDLGSGAGLPGLVLAIAGGLRVELVEADRRKAAFLREAARITGADAGVHPVRIEQAELPPASVVTARALAPLPALLGLAAPLLAPGGVCLFPKGARAEGEIAAARAAWRFELERAGPPDRPVLVISELRRGCRAGGAHWLR